MTPPGNTQHRNTHQRSADPEAAPSDPPERGRRPILPQPLFGAATITGIAAWLLVVGLSDPAAYPGWYRCPLDAATGLLCPGCGSTRATHALLNAQPLMSLRNNPLVILLGLPALAVLLRSAALRIMGRSPALDRLPGWTGYAVLAIVLSFWLVRNIPLDALEPLRPLPATHEHATPPAETPPDTPTG
jgi:hypothetical protein